MNYATYNITDDKIRASFDERLSPEDYQRMKRAGFAYWHGSKLFVAKWSTAVVDLLAELGIAEIEDDDTPDDVEARVDRFSRYADNAAKSAELINQQVETLAGSMPFGQPILVGHHSEGRARRDAKRIESGQRKALSETERAQYRQDRIAGSIRNAQHKEQPGVIARRIAKLEADLRRYQRDSSDKAKAELHARLFSDARYALAKEFQANNPDTWTPESEHQFVMIQKAELNRQVRESLDRKWAARTVWAARWIEHIEMLLQYQRALLAATGYVAATPEFVKVSVGDYVRVWGRWQEAIKINSKSVITKTGQYRHKIDRASIAEVITAAQYGSSQESACEISAV